MKYIISIFIIIFFTSCLSKQYNISQSATILFKTPTMKFYDKGFITKYINYTKIEIYSVGKIVLNLDIYDDRVCKSTFECESLKSFNKKYLNSSYKDDFLKLLFESEDKKVVFRDKKNKILIKILKD